jgi:hypothetical protein
MKYAHLNTPSPNILLQVGTYPTTQLLGTACAPGIITMKIGSLNLHPDPTLCLGNWILFSHEGVIQELSDVDHICGLFHRRQYRYLLNLLKNQLPVLTSGCTGGQTSVLIEIELENEIQVSDDLKSFCGDLGI